MAWIGANTSVSYFEPLHLWTLKMREPPTKGFSDTQYVDEWKPKVYQTSFLMTAKGEEVGVATLEYTPPLKSTVRQVAEVDLDMFCDDSAMPETHIETKKQILF
jgi:hypothetical protein